jgi:hypothetical protein
MILETTLGHARVLSIAPAMQLIRDLSRSWTGAAER